MTNTATRHESTIDLRSGREVDTRNVFFISLDEFNRLQLESMRGAERFEFHPLLGFDDIPRSIEEVADVDALLDECRRRLDTFDGSVDGIATFWDFPAAEMHPILCHERGLPGPSLEAVLRCHHKYWARLEQHAVAPESVPDFRAVDIYDDESVAAIDLPYPYWLKPVRAYSSHLGFRIRRPRDLHAAVAEIRKKLPRLREPFNQILRHADLPPEVAEVDGGYCIAESIISGRQCTLEGWVYDGEPHVFGVIDSRRVPNGSSFSRYQYPSLLPRRIQQRMIDITERLMRHIDYDGAAFNIEFFWREDTDQIWLLEINSRVSQSHAELFSRVDGSPNLQVAAELAVGERPTLLHGQGEHRYAAKFYIRECDDAVVRRAPTDAEIGELQERFPTASVLVEAREGTRLGELSDQDSYTYEIGTVFLAADSQRELLKKYRDLTQALHFEFDYV